MAESRSNRTRLVVLILTGAAVLLIGCSLISNMRLPGQSGEEAEGETELPGVSSGVGEGATDLQDQIENGDLVWVGGDASGEGPTGPVIGIRLSNPGDDDIETVIPCGSTLIPEDSGDQAMMVVECEPVTIPAGEEVVVAPYVVCIDASAAIPGDGSEYALGGLAEGDLLRLAQCVGEEGLDQGQDPLGGMSVQFAAWMAAEGRSLSEALEQGGGEEGAMGEFLGGQFGEMVADMLGTLEQPAMELLDRCGIELGN